MTNRFEEQIPGVTFHHKGARHFKVGGKNKATITLECDIENLALWDEIERKFKEGFRVFTSGDFHLEVMDAMRLQIQDLERAIEEQKRLLQVEKERGEESCRLLRKYESILGKFGNSLRGG